MCDAEAELHKSKKANKKQPVSEESSELHGTKCFFRYFFITKLKLIFKKYDETFTFRSFLVINIIANASNDLIMY